MRSEGSVLSRTVHAAKPRPRVPRSKKTRMPKVRDRTDREPRGAPDPRAEQRSGGAPVRAVPPRTAAEVKDQSLAVGLGSFSLQADLTDSTGTAYSASYSFTNTNHHAVHALRNARERALDALWGAPVR